MSRVRGMAHQGHSWRVCSPASVGNRKTGGSSRFHSWPLPHSHCSQMWAGSQNTHGCLLVRKGIAASLSAEPSAPASTEATEAHPSDPAADLLQWLVEERGATPDELKVEVGSVSWGAGRGLIAKQDVEPGEVLLSVPFTTVFEDIETNEESPYPWSARMALRLLQERRHNARGLKPWIDSLPQHVPLPAFDFSPEEVKACQSEEISREANNVAQSIKDSFQEMEEQLAQLGYGWTEFVGAVSVLHSRSFVVGPSSQHIVVPGVDMANHSPRPTAEGRIIHNPDACQGKEAAEEVGPPSTPSPSRFELLVGDRPIHAGQEITIDYGRWPNDVFLLYFGFVPRENPMDSVVLFSDLDELVHFAVSLQAPGFDPSRLPEPEALTEQLVQALGDKDWRRLVVVSQGFDSRAMQAAKAFSDILQKVGHGDPPSAGAILVARCAELLNSFPSHLEADQELLRAGNLPPHMDLALRYRASKKTILLTAIMSRTRAV